MKRVKVRKSSEPYLRTLFLMLLGVKRAIDMDIFETSALLRELMLSHMTFIPFICVRSVLRERPGKTEGVIYVEVRFIFKHRCTLYLTHVDHSLIIW